MSGPSRPPARPSPGASAAPAAAPESRSPDPPRSGGGGCSGDVQQEVLQHVLTATFWIDIGDSVTQYPSAIRFTGRRAGLTGALSREDRFEQEEALDGVPPGAGPVSLTTQVRGVQAGDWLVRALPSGRRPGQGWTSSPARPDGNGAQGILRSKGNPVGSARPGSPASTRLIVFASAPGTIPMSWPALVTIGLMTALALLAVLLARVHVSVGAGLAVALAASVAGAAGARAWYVMLQRGKVEGVVTRGLCVQGFVAAMALAGVVGLLLAGIPVGTFFDAAAPGLFFAMAIGRQGCFFTGCCVGRPTASRWGIWSSDGRIGARRLPAQQLESLVCLLIGAAAILIFLRFGRSSGGAVFIGAMAVYILARQGLLALRAEARRWSLARPVTLAAAGAALLADIVLSVVK